MDAADQSLNDPRELTRLRDEVEQLRTALEASSEEVDRLAQDRERLLRRVTAQARELQSAAAAYRQAGYAHGEQVRDGLAAHFRSAQESEELRIAFEEMQVLTEELEVANTSLQETNRLLDQRVAARTRDLELKNAALAHSEQRFRVLVEGVPQLVWRAVHSGEWTWASPQWTAFTGQAEADSRDWGWLGALHPDDRDDARKAWSAAAAMGRLQGEFRIRRAADGGYRWFQTRATPVRDEADEIVEWLGTSTDVEELRALQERQRVLLFELQHRVRNTLAVVRSLSKSTAETSDTVADFASHFEGRLSALARTQMVLTRSPDGGVDLETMVREELLAQTPNVSQIKVAGPDVRLSAKAAGVLALALHELATNAVKYGALASPGGAVAVRWSTVDDHGESWLLLRWEESGVRVLARVPRREGFGTELVTQRVPYELSGSGSLDLRPDGMHAEIGFPMRTGESILQTKIPEL